MKTIMTRKMRKTEKQTRNRPIASIRLSTGCIPVSYTHLDVYKIQDEFDYAPLDFEDAVDSYDKVLEITGDITGEIIAANAEGVDEEGPHCANGRVEYASGRCV